MVACDEEVTLLKPVGLFGMLMLQERFRRNLIGKSMLQSGGYCMGRRGVHAQGRCVTAQVLKRQFNRITTPSAYNILRDL